MTIQLNNFGKEDLSKLTERDILSIFERGSNAILQYVNKVYLNDKIPENKNVYIPSLKNKYGTVYKNNKWMQDLIEKIIDQIFENTHEFISDNYPVYKDKLCKRIQVGIEEWLLVAINDDKYSKETREQIKLVLHNMKDMIK